MVRACFPAVMTILVAAIWFVTGAAADQKLSTVPKTPDRITLSFAPIVEKTLPAVVNIYARKVVRAQLPTRALDGSAFWRLFRDTLLFGYGRDRFEKSLGSGVIIAPHGIVVTNHHVIQSAQGILVALADGRIFAGQVMLSDKKTDIAILRIAPQRKPYPFIEFGDSDQIKVGDLVVAIGNPFGIGQTVTSGIVSALARTSVGISDFRFFIQTDAAINPGNSGGALISTQGKLLGINTAIFSSTRGAQGLGFAVPVNMVRPIVESAVRGRSLLRPWIGVSGRQISARLATAIGVSKRRVIIITSIFPEGPAARAGLKIGDIVLSLDGFPIADFQSLRYRIATKLVGDNIDLLVVSKGVEKHVEVDLVPPPDKPTRNDTWLPAFNPFSGAKVASLSPALAEDFGLESTRAGVVVLDVRRGASAWRIGLRKGDIIRAFDNQKIHTVDEIAEVRLPLFEKWRIIVTRSGKEISISRR